ncbi:hypothetical protein LPJ79_001491 [Coemansia sp. RSA 1821]|nr:armadillo-type protein [Coemansia mojavensis]KAJ1743478.1 hypothetical protein LPJ68_000977 [Coemansia sp. RSA 1086]KAJ1752082.1 hypothetical protein LPJ79_001491 [Coemansia sp. RSA 1821]KAJ2670839.1 hypothetical protein IWW42_003708 [Coemansia sp. RSA 1085]
MGRAQKRTFKARANPLGTAAVPGAATAVQSKEEVPVLLKKLSSSDANDRVWAAASASNLLMSEDDSVRRMLLSNGVIAALVERLSDSVPDVVVQASGALHALVAMDHGAAVEVSRRNVFAAVQALIPRLAASIDGIIRNSEESQQLGASGRKLVMLTADNIMSLLRVLCETVPASLNQINDMALAPFIVSFFKVAAKMPPSLVHTAGQLLHTLTDENTTAKRALLNHSDAVSVLFSVVQAQNEDICVSADDAAIVRMLAGAVLMNLKDAAIKQLEATASQSGADIAPEDARLWDDATRAVLRVVSSFIAFDPHEAASQALQLAKTVPEAPVIASPEPSRQEAELDRLRYRIDYVQLALELAANIFTDEGTNDADAEVEVEAGAQESASDDEEDEKDEGDEDMADDASVHSPPADFDEADMNDVLGDEAAAKREAEDAVQQSILGMFIETIVPHLLRLAEPTTATFLASATAGCVPNVASRMVLVAEDFAALNERALGCFNNFLLVIEESLRPWFRMHSDNVAQWWACLVAVAERLLAADSPSADLANTDQQLRFAVLDPTIGCMWTLARCVEGSVPVTPEQIEGLIHVYIQAPSSALRIKAVGALGNIARRHPGHIEANRRIGCFLLDQAIATPLQALTQSSTASVRVAVEPIVEALDLLFDIYGDMEFDYDEPVFVRENMLARLRQLYIPVRKLAKTVDRRKHRSLRDRCDLAVQNLRAFIDYKASERKAAR